MQWDSPSVSILETSHPWNMETRVQKSWAGASPQESILSAKSQKDLEVLGILCYVP